MSHDADNPVFHVGDCVWYQDENGVWAEATVEEVSSYRCTLVLKESGDIVQESTKYIVPANPAKESVNLTDLSRLTHVNEPCLIQHLKQASDRGDGHTLAGRTLFFMNKPNSQRAGASSATVQQFASRVLLDSQFLQQSQSICVLGASQNGRSNAFKSLANALLGYSVDPNLRELIQHAFVVLKAFGNASTQQCADSPRHSTELVLRTTADGRICAASLSTSLLENRRAVKAANPKERLFHILHLLPAVATAAERVQLHLPATPEEFTLLKKHSAWKPLEDGHNPISPNLWLQLTNALQQLGMDALAVLPVVVAVLWLGNVRFEAVDRCAAIVDEARALSSIPDLLGCDREMLRDVLTTNSAVAGRVVRLSVAEAEKKRDLLCVELYAALFSCIVSQINVALQGHKTSCSHSISLLHLPEWEESNSSAGRLQSLLYNYANEALQANLVADTIKQPQTLYESEGLKWEPISYDRTCMELVNSFTSEPPKGSYWGIIPLLQDYSNMVGVSDSSLGERLSTTLASLEEFEFSRMTPEFFSIHHTCGKVEYTFNGMLASNVLTVAFDIQTLLKGCHNPAARACASVLNYSELPRSLSVTGQPSLNRPTLASKTCQHVQSILSAMQGKGCYYVLCLNPTPYPTAQRASWSALKSQIRKFNVRKIVQVAKAGFPRYLPYSDAVQLFTRLLTDPSEVKQITSRTPARAAPHLFELLGLRSHEYRLGTSHVFFTSQDVWDKLVAQWLQQSQAASSSQSDLVGAQGATKLSQQPSNGVHGYSPKGTAGHFVGMGSAGGGKSFKNIVTVADMVVGGAVLRDGGDGDGNEVGEVMCDQAGEPELEKEVQSAQQGLVQLRQKLQLNSSLRNRLASGSLVLEPDLLEDASTSRHVPVGSESEIASPQVSLLQTMPVSGHSAVTAVPTSPASNSEYLTPRASSFASNFTSGHPAFHSPDAATPTDSPAAELGSKLEASWAASAGPSSAAAATLPPAAGVSSITSLGALSSVPVATGAASTAMLATGTVAAGALVGLAAAVTTRQMHPPAADTPSTSLFFRAPPEEEDTSLNPAVIPPQPAGDTPWPPAQNAKPYQSIGSLRFPATEGTSLNDSAWFMNEPSTAASMPVCRLPRPSASEPRFSSAPLDDPAALLPHNDPTALLPHNDSIWTQTTSSSTTWNETIVGHDSLPIAPGQSGSMPFIAVQRAAAPAAYNMTAAAAAPPSSLPHTSVPHASVPHEYSGPSSSTDMDQRIQDAEVSGLMELPPAPTDSLYSNRAPHGQRPSFMPQHHQSTYMPQNQQSTYVPQGQQSTYASQQQQSNYLAPNASNAASTACQDLHPNHGHGRPRPPAPDSLATATMSMPAPVPTPFATYTYIPSVASAPPDADPEALRYRTLDGAPANSTNMPQAREDDLFRDSSGASSPSPSPAHTPSQTHAARGQPHTDDQPVATPSLGPSPWGNSDMATRVLADMQQHPSSQPSNQQLLSAAHHRQASPHILPSPPPPSAYREITPATSAPDGQPGPPVFASSPNSAAACSPRATNAASTSTVHHAHGAVVVPHPAGSPHRQASPQGAPKVGSQVGPQGGSPTGPQDGPVAQPPITAALLSPRTMTPNTAALFSPKKMPPSAAGVLSPRTGAGTVASPGALAAQSGWASQSGPGGSLLQPLPASSKFAQKHKGYKGSPLGFATELQAELLQTVSVVDDDITFLTQVREGVITNLPQPIDICAQAVELSGKFDHWQLHFAKHLELAHKYVKQNKGVFSKDELQKATLELKNVERSFYSWKAKTKASLAKLKGEDVANKGGAGRFLPDRMKALLSR